MDKEVRPPLLQKILISRERKQICRNHFTILEIPIPRTMPKRFPFPPLQSIAGAISSATEIECPSAPQDERPGYPIKECRLLMGSSLIIQGAADASERPRLAEKLGLLASFLLWFSIKDPIKARPARSRGTGHGNGPPGIFLGEEDLMFTAA
ncbi:hypothetical protein CEXT_705561 [Caerostris extrusa]|uniref:Uncharacterized protein n=1 Tax=Caerostris extrusa TaxID=172846 RepID=A0AAV4Q7E9_CAEEX|nr:hypothetical protein CEXT_705561 [Caerostris extrusa]